MLTRALLLFLTALAVAPDLGLAQSTSPNGVRTLDPPGAIKAEGTWSRGVRAGDFVFVAGMQGVDTHWSRIRRPESYAPSSILS